MRSTFIRSFPVAMCLSLCSFTNHTLVTSCICMSKKMGTLFRRSCPGRLPAVPTSLKELTFLTPYFMWRPELFACRTDKSGTSSLRPMVSKRSYNTSEAGFLMRRSSERHHAFSLYCFIGLAQRPVTQIRGKSLSPCSLSSHAVTYVCRLLDSVRCRRPPS
ncbi:hypothetical protein BKA66DRAFT_457617 [Pyrenochaeta sp. MPI-SDFR-AT-0127]|nr:hypothetical protein BKA66DRAFT_457617 [Pyrenochaeta sp. MPI-SDFR-AT-0127]